jgi:hypothetical protein
VELNYRVGTDQLSEEARAFMGGRVFLDGVEIFQAWYINTDTRVIKTYDVLGDRKPHSIRECGNGIPSLAEFRALIPPSPHAEGWEVAYGVEVVGSVLSKTIGGKEIRLDAPHN